MKNQALFSPKDKSKKLQCRLPQFLFGALRFNTVFLVSTPSYVHRFCYLSSVKSLCEAKRSLKVANRFYFYFLTVVSNIFFKT